MWRRTGALEAALARRPARRPRYDFSALDDRELEALAVLAEKAEAASGVPDWTDAEQALLARLDAKVAATAGAAR